MVGLWGATKNLIFSNYVITHVKMKSKFVTNSCCHCTVVRINQWICKCTRKLICKLTEHHNKNKRIDNSHPTSDDLDSRVENISSKVEKWEHNGLKSLVPWIEPHADFKRIQLADDTFFPRLFDDDHHSLTIIIWNWSVCKLTFFF